ncbi:MAG TPA: cytidine deaminase [Clostridiales bacterium]|nr:cytidine deaminase [Clostridiales bacterium]
MNNQELIKYALEAREKSYSPYSKFKVGAAILTRSGKVFTGCNIESSSYTPTICAERTALSKCVSEGHTDLEKIAVVGSLEKISYPCGVCRQFLREFGDDIIIISATSENNYTEYKLSELLPNSFGPEDL